MRNCALYLGVKSFIGLAYSEVTPLAELCLSRVGRYSPEQSMADGKRVTPMRRFYIDCTAAYVWLLCWYRIVVDCTGFVTRRRSVHVRSNRTTSSIANNAKASSEVMSQAKSEYPTTCFCV